MTASFRASVGLLLLALVASSGAAAEDLPLALRDPGSGAAVRVDAEPGALHVVLFATWCPPCLAELERLSQLEARWGDLGYRLVIVAVNTRQDMARLARFVATDGPPGRLLFDADGAVQKRLGAAELPAHFVFDAAGTRVARSGGLDPAIEKAIEKLVRETGTR